MAFPDAACLPELGFPQGTRRAWRGSVSAARREVIEETLIDDLQFDWGEGYFETAPYSRNKVARYYLARTAPYAVTLPVRPELGRPEHHECRWVTLDEAMALASPRVEPVVRWAASTIATPSKALGSG